MKVALRPSVFFLILLTFLHIGAIIIMCILPFFWLICLASSIIISLHLIHCLKKYVFLKSISSIKQVEYQNNQWLLITANGNIIEAQIQGNSFQSPLLIILHFRPAVISKTITTLIFTNSCNPNCFRKLRAKLSTI